MAFLANQIVYPCKEYEDVALPFKSLLGPDGTLDIYHDVAGRGYFDIDYRKGVLVLKARGHVGLIPISDRAAIRVEPRTPIANLLYIICRSGVAMEGLAKYVRGYRETPGTVPDAERLYTATFLSALKSAGRVGLLKKYLPRHTEREMRGRLLLGRTVSRFRSHGIRSDHVFEVNDHTVNNPENRILKTTAERLLARAIAEQTPESKIIAQQLRETLRLFEPVTAGAYRRELIARDAPRLIRSLPRSHRFYEPALWLSYLIATNSGVRMESVGKAKFESVIIDMADVFERYVRKVCADFSGMYFGGCRVMDGNRNSVPLFATGGDFPTKPDVYFKRGSTCLAVADVKYKPRVAAEDRYELLAFCESLGVTKAAFVCPQMLGNSVVSHHGTTASGRVIHIVTIDLCASDPQQEEAKFAARLGAALGF